ncbi:MAG: glycosyltransferase family 2 protein [Frankiales bacterium]|nr:glycosyltransferase family 2 protein [Frankiales bacterium]
MKTTQTHMRSWRMEARTSHPRISIIVPARNEAKNLAEILPTLPPVHEVILIDGHSVDGTIETAKRVMPGIRVVQQTRKGKGNALACGFNVATGDIIVMFDADGSADPAEIVRFESALRAGADFAKGTRFGDGGGSEDITVIRRSGNAFLNRVMNTLFRSSFSDLCYGYNAFWRDMLPLLDLPATDLSQPADGKMLWGDGFEIESLISCRFAASDAVIAEVGSVERLRIHGESNLHAVSDGWRCLQTILAEKRRARAQAQQDRTIQLDRAPAWGPTEHDGLSRRGQQTLADELAG